MSGKGKLKTDRRRSAYRRLIERDNGERCHYCGEGPPDFFDRSGRHVTELQVDHLVPTSQGGKHRLSNLVLACQRCNAKKGAKPYQEFVDSEAWV